MLELVEQKSLSSPKGGSLKALDAFFETLQPLTAPEYLTLNTSLTVSIQSCFATRNTSRDHHKFSGKQHNILEIN